MSPRSADAGPSRDAGEPSGRSTHHWEYLALLALGGMWGSAFPFIRLGLLAGAPALLFASFRFLGAAAVVSIVAAARREAWPARRDLALSALWGGGLLVAGYMGFLYTGEESVTAGIAAVLIASGALWSALLGYTFLPQDRLGRAGMAGILIGFLGVSVLFLPDLAGGSYLRVLPLLFVLGAALAFAIGSVGLRKTVSAPQGTWALSAEFALGGLLLLVLALAAGETRMPLGSSVTLSLGYLIVVPSVLGYSVYFLLHHRVGPLRANVVAYVNPIAGILLGMALLGETVTGYELGGFLLIVAGIYLVQRDRGSPAEHPPGTPTPASQKG